MNAQTKALEIAVSIIYLADDSDYLTALWEIVQVLGGNDATDLLEKDERAAYELYCTQEPPEIGVEK